MDGDYTICDDCEWWDDDDGNCKAFSCDLLDCDTPLPCETKLN